MKERKVDIYTETISRNTLSLMERMSRFDDLLKINSSAEVWHYTCTDALFGMLSRNQLRLGCASQMNDKNELISSASLIFEEMRLRETHETKLGAILRNGHNLKSLVNEVYLMSFTRNHDSLSQWKGYANRPNGIAIKFSLKALRKLTNSSGVSADLMNVIYKASKQRSIASSLSRIINDYINNHKTTKSDLDNMAGFADLILSRLICGFKDSGWEEENEIRIIRTPSNDTKDCKDLMSRESKYGIIKSYLYLDFTPVNSITEIMFLEKMTNAQEINFVKKYLRPFGMENTKITYSKLKMRF